MKKLIKITLLLLLVIFMFSCTQQNEVQETTNIEVTELVADAAEPFFMLNELPDIGEFGGKSSGRFYEEYTPDFIPSDEYGEIIPYIGTYKIYTKNDGEPAQSAYGTYGFCTTDGRIVMDASKKTSFIYYDETQDGFGYYRVSRSMEQADDAPDEAYPTETLIIPRSGAWCLTLTGSDSFSAIGNGILGVHIMSQGWKLYDYYGNKLIYIADALSVRTLSQGLMAVLQMDDSNVITYYNYMDLQGNVVLGPYFKVSDFNEYGIAAIINLGGGAYLINTDGERLTENKYSSISAYYSNDYERQIFAAQYASDDKVRDVFDAEGNLLGNMNGRYVSIRLPKNGEVIYYAYDGAEGSGKWKRLSDGSDFVSLEYGVFAERYLGSSYDDVFIHRDEDKKRAILFDADGETIAVLENFGSLMSISEDRRYLTYSSSGGEDGTQKLYVYDTEAEKNVFTMEADGYASFIGKEDRYVRFVLYNSTEFYDQTSTYFLYDTHTESMVFSDCMWITEIDLGDKVYFNVCTPNASVLYDEDLNIILRCYSE